MADVKISALPASTTPLAGTEVLPIVQSSTTKQVSVANLTAGRAVSALSLTSTTTLGVTGVSTLTGGAVIQGLTVGLGANAVAGNTAVGLFALASGSLSGGNNTALGAVALTALTTGVFNTAVGQSALNAGTSGNYNAAVGASALALNTSGANNSAVGAYSLSSNISGSSNIGVGVNAGNALTTGSNNTIIGSVAGTAGLSDTVIIAAGATERMRIDSSGNVGIGGAPSGGPFNVRTNIASGAYSAGIQSTGQVQSAVSTRADMFLSSAACAAGTYTQITGYQAQQGTLTGTVTNQIGFNVDSSLTGATNNYGFYGAIASGTNRYNLYMAGTAANYLGGALSVAGDTTLAAYTETIVASGTVGSTATLAITAGTVLTATLTSATACTFTMPTATAGKSFILLLKQPASGTATTATFTSVKWNSSGAPTITATVGKMDILTFVSDGTNWYGSYSQGYTP